MKINLNNLVSITEANQNFSRVAHLVDEQGAAVIMKNNTPRYILMAIKPFEQSAQARDEDVETIGGRILEKHKKAFEALAK
ncbi:MAG: type II toxin-antitoxin system Phd/YefM family antitoxin [Christensenellales bacterium]|jgi:antitoxin Phd